MTEDRRLKTTIIAVVGSKKSGKTTTIEALTSQLSKRGYKIATVKHISEPHFTIDTEGKDSWRFAQAGAKTIILASSDEIATIEKKASKGFSLDVILKKCEGNDIVFFEGFRELVSEDRDIHKIVVVRSAEEALEAMKSLTPIMAFTGPYSTKDLNLNIPYADSRMDPGKIAGIVENVAKRSIS